MLFGIGLEGLREGQDGEIFALAERGDSVVGIKQVSDAEMLLKAFADGRIGPYLDAGIFGDREKHRMMLHGVVADLSDELLSDLPGVLP